MALHCWPQVLPFCTPQSLCEFQFLLYLIPFPPFPLGKLHTGLLAFSLPTEPPHYSADAQFVAGDPSLSLSEFIGQRQARRGRFKNCCFQIFPFFAPSFHLCLCDVYQFLGLLNLRETSLLSVSPERKSFFQSLGDSSLLASRTVTVLKRHVRGGV